MLPAWMRRKSGQSIFRSVRKRKTSWSMTCERRVGNVWVLGERTGWYATLTHKKLVTRTSTRNQARLEREIQQEQGAGKLGKGRGLEKVLLDVRVLLDLRSSAEAQGPLFCKQVKRLDK